MAENLFPKEGQTGGEIDVTAGAEPMRACCGNCKHWKEEHPQFQQIEKGKDRCGVCERHPPNVWTTVIYHPPTKTPVALPGGAIGQGITQPSMDSQPATAFPMTSPNCICGDHEWDGDEDDN